MATYIYNTQQNALACINNLDSKKVKRNTPIV